MRKGWILGVALALACGAVGQAFAADDGAAVYARCAGCHKATGVGTPGLFPPLAGHVAKLETAGRAYLIQVVLFGLKGKIEVEGKTYNGTMPAYAGLLNDGETAAVLDYVLSSWGNGKALPKDFAKVTPAEVQAQRAANLTSEQVYLARMKLKLE